MTLFLDLVSPVFFFVPILIIVLIITAIGVGIYFIVRALKKKNGRKENGQ